MNERKKLFDLIDKIGCSDSADKIEDLDTVRYSVKEFVNYINKVVAMEIGIKIARFTLDGEKYRDKVEELDSNRRSAHESAIVETNVINRIAEMYGAKPVYTGKENDRLDVADFCLAITDQLFENRTQGRVISDREVDENLDQEMERDR